MLFRRKGKGGDADESANPNQLKRQIKTGIMGNLAREQSKNDRQMSKLMREIEEDEKGRITIIPPEEDPPKKGKRKPNKNGRQNSGIKRRKNQEKIKEQYEKDYVWVRKELEGYAPLRSLDIWNKIKTSIRYMDEKSGKTARKNAEVARIENMKRIKIESEIKKKITDYTDDILEKRMVSQELEISCKPEHIEIIKSVLSQEYFTMFNISIVEINPNLKRYGINPPVLVNITSKGVKSK